jgi:hypothetical protein
MRSPFKMMLFLQALRIGNILTDKEYSNLGKRLKKMYGVG